MNDGNYSSANPQRRYYTPKDAARILHKSDRWVRRQLEKGELEGERSPTGRWRVSAKAVEERRLHDRRMSLTNESPETVHELTDQLIELSIELGRTQARLHMAEDRALRLEQDVDELRRELEEERSKNNK